LAAWQLGQVPSAFCPPAASGSTTGRVDVSGLSSAGWSTGAASMAMPQTSQ
jgi:hypothetical protein